jgi:TolB-like protein/Tfp pilus assembly protein PilF
MGRSDSEYVASWGPFRIESAGVIFQGEIPVPGTPQVATALASFFRRCGHVTTREELKEAVWGKGRPGGQYGSESGNIDTLVYSCRRALGDYEKYLETRSRIGWILHRLRDEASLRFDPRIAVLPFEGSGDDTEAEKLTSALGKQLVTCCRAAGIKTVDWETVTAYVRRRKRRSQRFEDLGVSHVVRGSVSVDSNDVQLVIELVAAGENDGRILLNEVFDGQTGRTLRMQYQIAKKLAHEIGIATKRATGAMRTEAVRPEAEKQYLLGRYHWNRTTIPDLFLARSHFEQAIANDPSFGRAYGGIADALVLLGLAGELSGTEALRQAMPAAEKAINLEPQGPYGHHAMAAVKGHLERDWHGSERESLTALELDPLYPTARHGYAMASLISLGRFDDAMEQISKAMNLEPCSPFIAMSAGVICFYAHQYDEAIGYLDVALKLDPHFRLAHWHRAWAFQAKGDLTRAIAGLTIVDGFPSTTPQCISALGHAYARAGKRSEAKEVLARLNSMKANRYVSPYEFALVNLGLGERSLAMQELEAAINDRTPAVTRLKAHPFFAELRGEKEFDRLLTLVGFESSDRTRPE